jgi:hypothetical protein
MKRLIGVAIVALVVLFVAGLVVYPWHTISEEPKTLIGLAGQACLCASLFFFLLHMYRRGR